MTLHADPVWAMIKSCSLTTLVTADPSGRLQAHPLTASQEHYDGNLWFFSLAESAAVADIDREPQVCVLYSRPTQADVISISGSALVVTQIAQKQRLWNAVAQAAFPQGPTCGSLVLLRIAVEQARYWDAHTNKLVRLSAKSRPWHEPNALHPTTLDETTLVTNTLVANTRHNNTQPMLMS